MERGLDVLVGGHCLLGNQKTYLPNVTSGGCVFEDVDWQTTKQMGRYQVSQRALVALVGSLGSGDLLGKTRKVWH